MPFPLLYLSLSLPAPSDLQIASNSTAHSVLSRRRYPQRARLLHPRLLSLLKCIENPPWSYRHSTSIQTQRNWLPVLQALKYNRLEVLIMDIRV